MRRLLRWLLRRPTPARAVGPHEWMVQHPGRNQVHDTQFPECDEPLPHGHHLFDIHRETI